MNQSASHNREPKTNNQQFSLEPDKSGSRTTGIWKYQATRAVPVDNIGFQHHSVVSSVPFFSTSKFHDQSLVTTTVEHRKLGLTTTPVSSGIYASTTDDETSTSDQEEFISHLFSEKLSYEDGDLQSKRGSNDNLHLFQNRDIPTQQEIEDTDESSGENGGTLRQSTQLNKQNLKNYNSRNESKASSQCLDRGKPSHTFLQGSNLSNSNNSVESFQYNSQSAKSLTSPSSAQSPYFGWGLSSMPYIPSTEATIFSRSHTPMDLDSVSSVGSVTRKSPNYFVSKNASQGSEQNADQYTFFNERLSAQSSKLPSSFPKSTIMPLWSASLVNHSQQNNSRNSPFAESRVYTATGHPPFAVSIPSSEYVRNHEGSGGGGSSRQQNYSNKSLEKEEFGSNQQSLYQQKTKPEHNELHMNNNFNEFHKDNNNNQKPSSSRDSSYSHMGSLMDLQLGISRFYPRKERELTLTHLNDLIILFDKYITSLKSSHISCLEPSNGSNTHRDLLPLFSNEAFNVTWIAAQVNFNKRERAQFLDWKEKKNIPNYSSWNHPHVRGAYADRNHSMTTSGQNDYGRPGGGREPISNLQASAASGSKETTSDSKKLQVRALRMLYPKKDLGYEELKKWNREFYKSHGDLMNALVKVLEMFGNITEEDSTSDEDNHYYSTDQETVSEYDGYEAENSGYTGQSNNNRKKWNKKKKKPAAANTSRKNKQKAKKRANIKDENPLYYYSTFNGEIVIRKKDFKRIKDFYRNHMRTLCAQMKQHICIQFNEEMRRNLEIAQKVFQIEF